MINCLVEYKNISHLNQLYTGFKFLHDANVINLQFSKTISHLELKNKPVIKVILDDSVVIYYDSLDGFNWIDKDESSNLKYFFNTFKCDYYFKRSYNSSLEMKGLGFKVLPLGLYYNITPYFDVQKSNLIGVFKKKFKNNKLARKLLKVNRNFYTKDFENYPNLDFYSPKILFSARLWDPSKALNKQNEFQRKEINEFRMDIVKRLKIEFGDNFIGGISIDSYSSTCLSKEYLLPFEFTNREFYLKTMKQSAICIATTGLHNSIGGKLTEYVAASRAIITEPLHYKVPGEFKKDKNYLEFNNVEQLIDNVNLLLQNKNRLREMMVSNSNYYNNSLRPDRLVFNTLIQTLLKF